jgi:hypothetical protein
MTHPGSFVPEPWASGDDPAGEWWYVTGSIEQALAYAELFWPQFVVHEGCVLLARSIDGYGPWSERLEDKADIEAMLNHRHILDLFHDAAGSEPHEWLISLGRTLKECWAAKLRLEFPERRFEVVFDETPCADPVDYQITFYQQR